MKRVQVEVNLFEKGDRVLTPCGTGVVLLDEVFPTDDRCNREVFVQHDSGLSANPSNRPQWLDSEILCYEGKS